MENKTFLIVVLVFCQLASSQETVQNISRQSSRNSSQKASRAIASPKLDKKLTSDSKEPYNNSDAVFDNSPTKDSSGIVFPDVSPDDDSFVNISQRTAIAPVAPKLNKKSWKEIPSSTLVKLGKESNVRQFLEKYVSNAKATEDDEYNTILVDNEGNPLVNSKNERVVLATASEKRPFATRNEPVQPQLRFSVSGRNNKPEPRNGIGTSVKSLVVKQELCATEKRAVTIPLDRPPYMIIIPRCVRVDRCSGCCISELMECEPLTKEYVNETIQMYAYTGGENKPLEFVDNKIVTLEKHVTCSCKCKTKPEHCLAHHVYDESECSCKCKNSKDYIECSKDQNKIWDATLCMCLCREERDCSSGYFFNLNTCGCDRETDDTILSRSLPNTTRKTAIKA